MRPTAPSFTFGIEEEYYLVDRETRALAAEPSRQLIATLKARIGDRFSEEFMRSQVEIGTPICRSMEQARDALIEYRGMIGTLAADYGLAPIAAATHPFSHWSEQRHRNRPRYNSIAEDFQAVGRRMLICGQHVHIGIEDQDQRIMVMNALRPYLPILLALSTSSPFWGGERTGLKSYRTAINDSTPRKGMPEKFASWQAYQATVDVLIDAGTITDTSKIWWDLRPSLRYPTLEVRIMDVCPLVDDAICLTALIRCLSRAVLRSPPENVERQSSLLLINENRWRAQRYGLDESFIDPTTATVMPAAAIIERVLAYIRDDAEFFDCVAEVEHARAIVSRGTSADRQLTRYDYEIEQGADVNDALARVVDQLIEETQADVSLAAHPTWTAPTADVMKLRS